MNEPRTIRCRKCNLNQYETKNKLCRRCGTFFAPAIPPLPPPPMVVVEAPEPEIRKPTVKHSNNVLAISRRLVAYRMALGWSQTRLAKGLASGYISRAENGLVIMSAGYLQMLADRLGIPVCWLLEDVTEERLTELFARRIFLETRSMDENRRQYLLCRMKKLTEKGMRKTG